MKQSTFFKCLTYEPQTQQQSDLLNELQQSLAGLTEQSGLETDIDNAGSDDDDETLGDMSNKID